MTEVAAENILHVLRANEPPPGWFDVGEAAECLGITTRTVRRQCRKGELDALRYPTPAGPAWYVNPACHPALRLVSGLPPKKPDHTFLSHLPDRKQVTAMRRLDAVKSYLAALDHAIEHPSRHLARVAQIQAAFIEGWNAADRKPRLALPTLRRWVRDYAKEGLAGLVDERRWHGEMMLSGGAWQFITGQFLSENRTPISQIYEQAEALAPAEGWTLPSYRRVCMMLAGMDRRVRLAGRDPLAFQNRCLPYIQRDWTKVPAMGCWVADHRQFDVVLVHQVKDLKGRKTWRWFRPWLTMYLDARSWMPVAWTISMDGPDGDRTMATFAKGVRLHGKPAFVYLDNGKDFRCLRFSGGRPQFAKKGETRVAEPTVKPILTLLGVESVFAIPFNAKAKVIEPFFRIVAERFDKTWPTYWGHKPDRRPENVRKLDPATCPRITLEEFSGAFDRWVTEDYALRKSPSEASAGLSAARAFLELRDPDFVPSRPDDATLSMLLMRSQAVTIQANGIYIRAFGRFYWSEKLDHLSAQDGKAKWAKVTYRYDPDDDSQIFVFKTNGQFLARAEPYIGSGLHPLAPRGSADSDRIGAVMALRRGRANRIQGEVQEARDFATNLLLRTSQDAARQLGRLDDPTTFPTPPNPTIQLIPDMTRAGTTRRDNPEPGARNPERETKEKTTTAADILADRIERFKGSGGGVGASLSALDILSNRKEQDHDDGDDGDSEAPA